MSEPTWDILICAIAHRTRMLELLLNELTRQLVPGVGVRVFWDNLETSVGEKRRRLLESSTAEYVSFVDDDDVVPGYYVSEIRAALVGRPDVVGFKVHWTEDGVAQRPVYHSLTHSGWFATDEGLYRDLSHLNPIRRELALRGVFEGHNEDDFRWAASLREQHCVKTEVWIDREMYWYRRRSADTFTTSSMQGPMVDPPPRPHHDVAWL